MKNAIKLVAAGVLVLFAGGVVYHLFWGKLFPYAPFFPGFTKNETPGAVVYVQRGARFDKTLFVDACLPAVEETHGLKFVKKPKIFIFRDEESYFRRAVSKARFYAYPNGAIFASPWGLKEAEEGRISLDIYLKHELSHVLLYQHMKLIPAYLSFPRWLLEGIATLRSDQMGTSWYPGKAETLKEIREGNFMPPGDFGKKDEDRVPLDVPYRSAFLYSEFACLVDGLIEAYGEEKFRMYLNRLMSGRRHEKAFWEAFGTDFETYLRKFRSS